MLLFAALALAAAGCALTTEEAGSITSSTTTTAGPATTTTTEPPRPAVTVGAEVLVESGFAVLDGARVGLIANQTSVAHGEHMIDLLAGAPNVELIAVFAPEHGVRGVAGAGELVDDQFDTATGTPIFSLYGETRRPTPEMLAGIDVLVYDLQDVGGRFYTYVSTMGLAMQAAGEAGIRFMVLDRPDPSGGAVPAGYVLEPEQLSFIGQYPVPAAYAMTPAELAGAIVGESWLDGLEGLAVEVVEMEGWLRGMTWSDTGLTWIPPSPGLQTPSSAVTYLGTVLFEATSISYGGGMDETFELVGAPWADSLSVAARLNGRGLPGVVFEPLSFTPGPLPGRTDNPRLNGVEVHGVRIQVTEPGLFEPVSVGVHVMEEFHRAYLEREPALDDQDSAVDNEEAAEEPEFINRSAAMALLAGTDRLELDLLAGVPAAEIVAGWADELRAFNDTRARYLRY